MTSTQKPRPEAVAGRLPKRVVIVGNNESAWMAAAYLWSPVRETGLPNHGRCQRSSRVVNSPGESSLPSLRGLLSNLQIDEHQMMQQTQGTYHLATQFSDWVQSERDFLEATRFHRTSFGGHVTIRCVVC